MKKELSVGFIAALLLTGCGAVDQTQQQPGQGTQMGQGNGPRDGQGGMGQGGGQAQGGQTGEGQYALQGEQTCTEMGGTVGTESKQNGNEYHVCLFDETHECELMALVNGSCAEGGVDITTYTSDGEKECAVKGGSLSEDKQTCTFIDTSTCDVSDAGLMCGFGVGDGTGTGQGGMGQGGGQGAGMNR